MTKAIEARDFSAEEFRADSMSIHSSGKPVTMESLEAIRNAHPETIRTVEPPGEPSWSIYELRDRILSTT